MIGTDKTQKTKAKRFDANGTNWHEFFNHPVDYMTTGLRDRIDLRPETGDLNLAAKRLRTRNKTRVGRGLMCENWEFESSNLKFETERSAKRRKMRKNFLNRETTAQSRQC